MNCLNPNCNITANDRMVSCWLCLECCHLKCCGLKARDADALTDPAKSLQWCCPRCKTTNLEFYKFFKNFKSEFDQITNELKTLQTRFSKFGELFTNFNNLDKFLDGQNCNSPMIRTPDVNATNIPLVTISQAVTPSPTNSDHTAANSIHVEDKTSPFVPLISNPPLLSEVVASTDSTSPLVSGKLPLVSPVIDNRVLNSANLSSDLRVIPPRKSIFATRFHHDTKTEEVVNYITTKLGSRQMERIKVFKISARNRASFKIIVPTDYFDEIVNPNFWPKYTIVREFVYHEEKLAQIPASNIQDPKN